MSNESLHAASCTRDLSPRQPLSLERDFPKSGKAPLSILQLNNEGWTTAKREVLQHVAAVHDANVVLIQETHQQTEDQLKLYGFTLADRTFSAHHGIATFVKNSFTFTHVGNSEDEEPSEWHTILIDDTQITNIYHPPPAALDAALLPNISSQSILAGDFNCRPKNLRYTDSNRNGEALADWASNNNLLILYDPKQPACFHSGRWNRGTNPDSAICTEIAGTAPVRTVLQKFPKC